jgi:hypothetical protein
MDFAWVCTVVKDIESGKLKGSNEVNEASRHKGGERMAYGPTHSLSQY